MDCLIRIDLFHPNRKRRNTRTLRLAMDDRTALLGEEPSTPREKPRGSRIIGKEFARFFVLGVFVAVGVFASADFIANTIPARRGSVTRLGRTWTSAAPLARWAHVAIEANVDGHKFVPAVAHRVVVLALSTGESLAQTYEWALSLKDVGVRKFMIGCVDDACLKTLQALDAPVFDASASAEKFSLDGESREDACRWASLESAKELLSEGYSVILSQPTIRFRRNPMEVVADSISRHGRNSVFAMRGVHSNVVTEKDLRVWTGGTSLASLRDDFLIFTPGSQSLIDDMFTSRDADVPADVLEAALAGESSDLGSAELSWRSNVAFVLNHILSANTGLRWKLANGQGPVDAAPFKTKPYEVSVDAALLGEDGSVRGTTAELSGVARLSDNARVKVVLLDTVVARAHCNDAGKDNMAKTYVVGCDLDDAALAGRRVEVDHQCMLMKGLESRVGGLGVFSFFEHKGESPISDSRGFIGALDACRL